MRVSTITFATLIAGINALKITSPTAGQTLDPTQPITVTWTSDSSDPATIDILSSDPNGFISETRIGRDIQTSSGSYIVPAGSIQSYGTGFVIKVDSSDGRLLATSPSFDLSMGVGAQVNGQSGLVQQSTFTGTSAATRAASSASSAAAAVTSGISSVTGSTTSSASGSSNDSTTITGSRTGFSTSTMSGTSRSTSATHSASSTSVSSAATTSANAQPRLASGSQIVLSAAGLIAGLAALLA